MYFAIVKAVFSSGMIPVERKETIKFSLFKDKGIALDCSKYCRLKLIDQVMKLLEHVLDSHIHKIVNNDEMQHGFVPDSGTTGAIIVTRQLQEYIVANKLLYFTFINLGKTFDHVPRQVLWWELRGIGVEEWTVCIIRGM